MSKVRIYENINGSVSVIHPAPKSRRIKESEEDWLERVFTKATPPDVAYKDIDKTVLPKSREDREAWEIKNGKISINQIKKQQIDKLKQDKEKAKTDVIVKLKNLGLTEVEIESIKT